MKKMSKNSEELLRATYTDFLNQELKRPEVRQAKKDLIRTHFQSEPVWILRPQVFAPAFVSILIVALFFYLPAVRQAWKPVAMQKGKEATMISTPSIVPATEVVSQEAAPLRPPRVVVKKVSSTIGSTLVYQKSYNGSPITIIWVFTGGKG